MKRKAAIDIGTNSMRVLLCKFQDGKIIEKSKELITTRIGQGLGKNNRITAEAMDRNITALKVFKEKIDGYGAKETYAIATSAVRDAKNKEEFINRALTEVGLTIRVIDGEEEAGLGMDGVLSEFADENAKVLVLDVGGGSTELILGSKMAGIEYEVSIQAGAVRMTDQNFDENKLWNVLGELFYEAIEKLKTMKVDRIIAIGGTGTTCASIYHKMKEYDSEKVHNTIIPLNYFEDLYKKIIAMTLEERYSIIGLQPSRADIIPAGIAIIIYVMRALELKEITISENDNLEGMILRYGGE